jgi:hypothetical protein
MSDGRDQMDSDHRVVLIYEHTQLSPSCKVVSPRILSEAIKENPGSRVAEKVDGRSQRLEKTLKRMKLSPRVFNISQRALPSFSFRVPPNQTTLQLVLILSKTKRWLILNR